ncbi:TniB family NTP-binding protein [Nesterenkonia halotolerans]|uniref:ORC1/DEAH AAA+ ATPase domain-containing protein n=1 Tax=Nesterenkonia halotolerans TaxID=225325 RepID=A0ABR9J891_9MICC|nr:TniB family NTP-binding protein [Nesterenkonia halotolerans]MBE1515193.1 hypothetical protein [Nesterenkonia halotolerans]
MTNRFAQWLANNAVRDFDMAYKEGWNTFAELGPREPLPILSHADLQTLGDDELEDYNEARAVWNANPPAVHTAQLKDAFRVLDQVMASNYRDGDRLRGSAVIDAKPALGKTTIATRYARAFHQRSLRRHGITTPEGHQRIPVAFIPVDAGTTLKGLNQKLLSFYGHPGANRASTSRLAALAVDCVRSCQTKLIVFDDVHFIDYKHRRGQEVSNHFKGLANEMPATFIFVGVNLKAKKFFDEGLLGEDAAFAQTSRRATRISVSPFRSTSTSGMRAWCDVLGAFERHLMLLHKKPRMLTDLANELFDKTSGSIGSLTNILDRASLHAIASGEESINAATIAAVTGDNAAETSLRNA